VEEEEEEARPAGAVTGTGEVGVGGGFTGVGLVRGRSILGGWWVRWPQERRVASRRW